MSTDFKTKVETVEAESVRVIYEEVSETDDLVERAMSLDVKLYKNRYGISRNDANIIPKVKTRKLDSKLYRNTAKSKTSLVKDFEKHKIRSFSFKAI